MSDLCWPTTKSCQTIYKSVWLSVVAHFSVQDKRQKIFSDKLFFLKNNFAKNIFQQQIFYIKINRAFWIWYFNFVFAKTTKRGEKMRNIDYMARADRIWYIYLGCILEWMLN